MDMQRFVELAAAHGAARQRWPASAHDLYDRGAATPEGRRLLAEAAELDALLDQFETRTPDPLRAARIRRAVHAASLRRRLIGWASVGYAACALLGFSLGFSQFANSTEETAWPDMLIGTTVIEDYL